MPRTDRASLAAAFLAHRCGIDRATALGLFENEYAGGAYLEYWLRLADVAIGWMEERDDAKRCSGNRF